MIYRTSHRGTYRNITSNLDLLSYRIAQLTNKVASEKSINKPSDNPSGAAAVLRTRTVISDITQYTENVNYSNTWLTNTGNIMSSIKSTIDEIYTKAEQGATDTYTDDQRKIIATEIDALFQSIIQFADAKFGDNYLLSGQKVGTQPFSLDMMAQQVLPGCENSDLFTGWVEKVGSGLFNPRADLPTQSQSFLVEVVRAGGIDSQTYAEQNQLSSLELRGENDLGQYLLTLSAKTQAYNQSSIKLVAGPKNLNTTGTPNTNSAITYTYTGPEPLTIVYTYGDDSTPTKAAYDQATGTVTVTLQTDGGDPPKSLGTITAQTIADAVVNDISVPGPPPALTQLYAATSLGGNGHVDLQRGPNGVPINTQITFNNQTTVEVNGSEITVYLRTLGDSVVATAQEVRAALEADPEASQMVSVVSLTGQGSAGTFSLQNNPLKFVTTDPYTLARVETELPGTHNDLEFYVKNEPGAPTGSSGNAYSVVYVLANPPSTTVETTATYNAKSAIITVTLANSAAVFSEAYARIYYDSNSPGYLNAAEAYRLSRLEAITATALDVQEVVSQVSDQYNLHIGVKAAEGNSGLGKVYPGGPFQFAEGYDQTALVRVSQDGGLTWGPPTAFTPSEFQTGGLYYNSQLGHASLTTNLPGGANDIVLTANYLGTWGDDLRLEYKAPQSHPSTASVTVGPQPWNICVNLATNAQGQITTTADDIVNMINNHREASQLVTASLANYHEGGQGLVTAMDCQILSTGEPYEIAGQTRITPLGYATAAVEFSYSPPNQSCPNLIFQAIDHGVSGNDIGIRYTTSADTALFGAQAQYQDQVTIGYEKDEFGRDVVVVHLATIELPSCPDPEADRVAYDQFKALYPTYSCTTDRAVTSTAGDVLEALIAKNLAQPESALVWASMEYKDEGWDSTAKVGPTSSTIRLSGGDDSIKASDHGIALKFVSDGSALQEGDRYQIGVGWYNGDSNNLDINAMEAYRTTTNVTGDDLLGANGATDNVLDTIQRLSWALKHSDSELVAQELPKLKAALEKITTMETNVGTRIIRNNFVLNNLELNQYAAETILSETEDADFTRLITDLKNSQLVYEAVLGATGLTTKLSLLNYL
ncbi:MAG: hypothetical protein LBE80_04695 [Deltaproteobacteria bacterium]|jgi:flagellin-like hook-associated protein FlgL|nr:hypothetical protein [Deltaproteobacteria bacterium]